jgi:CubicO group peptidase (beta-lactamase class C family)
MPAPGSSVRWASTATTPSNRRPASPPTPAQQQAYQQAAVAWPWDPQGYHFGFGETKLPARDLAKFGYLYLNGGRWDTTQVVPADYVRASTHP